MLPWNGTAPSGSPDRWRPVSPSQQASAVSAQMIGDRQALAEDIDDAEFIGKLLGAHGDPDLSDVSSLGTVRRAGSTFGATAMDSDRDFLFSEWRPAPARAGRTPTRATPKQGRSSPSAAPFSSSS